MRPFRSHDERIRCLALWLSDVQITGKFTPGEARGLVPIAFVEVTAQQRLLPACLENKLSGTGQTKKTDEWLGW